MSRRCMSVSISRWLSRWCSPIVGSSRMYNTPTSDEPIWVASLIRWASPPRASRLPLEGQYRARPSMNESARDLLRIAGYPCVRSVVQPAENRVASITRARKVVMFFRTRKPRAPRVQPLGRDRRRTLLPHVPFEPLLDSFGADSSTPPEVRQNATELR